MLMDVGWGGSEAKTAASRSTRRDLQLMPPFGGYGQPMRSAKHMVMPCLEIMQISPRVGMRMKTLMHM
jgi:hypothetical protein